MKLSTLELLTVFIAETIATGLLVFLGCMGCASTETYVPSHLSIALGFGLTVMLIINIFGMVTGAHLNPAVTLAAYFYKLVSAQTAVVYCIGQLLGAYLGYGLLRALLRAHLPQDGNNFCVSAPNKAVGNLEAFGIEFMITLVLIFLCCGVWDPRNAKFHDSVALRFGLTVSCLALVGGPFSGGSMNPARSFGPALYNWNWDHQWLYWTAPLSAALIGAVSFRMIFYKDELKSSNEELPLREKGVQNSLKNFDLVVIKSCRVTQGEVHFKVKVRAHMMSKSKIPVRDLTPMFHQTPAMDKESHRSRRDKISSFSANFTPDRSKSLERHQRSNEKVKDMRNLINIKDNQIHDLVGKVTKLFGENEKLRSDKMILVENYNSLYEKFDRNAMKSNNLGETKVDNRVHLAEKLEKDNTDMKNDLKMLKILVFRLNKHIEHYQDLLNTRDVRFDSPKKHFDEAEITSSWEVKSHLLSPLMNSYEERIREKNDIIKSYEMELNKVSAKIKKILEENESLHETFDNLSKNSELWLSEKQRLTSQCEILKSKASIHCKRADLAKEKLVEVLKAYEQKVQSQALDIERLQEAYNRSKGEITTLKNFQKNPEAVAESIKDCQKLFEDLKIQFEVEKGHLLDERNSLIGEINQLKTQSHDLVNQITELNLQLEKQKLFNEALDDKNKSLKKSLYNERQSRENLEKEVHEFREFGNDKFKESWQNTSDLHALIHEKELIIQNLNFNQQKEIEELRNKLYQRDQTLRKVLESKVKI